MIDFNIPPRLGNEINYIREAFQNGKLCGDGPFTKRCSAWMQDFFHINHVLLTTSCTHALEMAALLAEVGPGDEVIMPSYTFVSTADAFVQRGASIVFADVDPATMNLDPAQAAEAVTSRTKAIVPVHYAGVSCDMDAILSLARERHLAVIEDAAQAFDSYYRGRPLGTVGDLGCFSFHETKNLSMGEGGALLFQSQELLERAEIIREKGTNRSKFFRGQIDKYTWMDYGSSYLPSDINAACLFAQLEKAGEIKANRLASWEDYHQGLADLEQRGCLTRPVIPDYATNNAHMYYFKTENLKVRTRLLDYLKSRGILAVFHYVPLHSAPAGRKFGRFAGEDRHTTKESERLVRLPMYYGLSAKDREYILHQIHEFYR